MAFPTAVNNQITDSVTQVNTKVLGDSPAVATGNFMLATSQALSNAAHNATPAQQSNGITTQAALVTGLNTMFTIDPASAAVRSAINYR
ncbi:RebB family R body protein [Shewanella sp. 10N.286.45.A1]|uniref:RebB family R body protein n=1 Tax=Shewanella sp. 10N.286.45.A1 TaxID=3229694 RepID=UPI0035527BD2